MNSEWACPPKQDGESEVDFMKRWFVALSDSPGMGACITQAGLDEMGGDLSAIPVPPKNVILVLDPQTANILAFSLPKEMDVFGLLEKAKE